jgi:tetratricopeptide (TPR) repeat protein
MVRVEQHLRVVLVSPGDVADERAAAQAVVDELNRGEAADRGCRLSLWRWETDAWPGLHLEGPQGQIDEQMDIEDADLVVGVFWRRFGTPTGDADSGTEHELRRARAAWERQGSPQVMVYFCTRAYAPQSPSELDQWKRVLEYRAAFERQALTYRYETEEEFAQLLREHLGHFLRTHPPAIQTPATAASTPVAASRVRFRLPAVAASFTGRGEELDALDEALGVADRAVVTQAITGLGGVGKTQLAARYVQQRSDRYDVVAWIRAEDGGIADLAALAAKLGGAVDGLSPSERAQLALDRLGDGEQRWLLVLDNVASAEQLSGLIPGSGSGRVLVTSRDRALRQFGPVLTVDVFDEDIATRYLTERAGRRGDEQAARALARALGCLPLALSHAAAYCQSGTSFGDYLQLLGDLPSHELFDAAPELFYERTVASTWRTSIEAASATAPLAAEALELAAYLGPDAIPKALFGELVDVDTPRGRKHLGDALNALARFSLATVDDDTVSVHRLLQKTVRDDAAARGDRTAGLRALGALDDAFPADIAMPSQWPLCERLLAHALALADALPEPGNAGPRLIALLNRACHYLIWAEGGRRSLQTGRATLRHAERILGAEHAATLTTRNRVATAELWAGHTAEAIAIYEPLLTDHERILGPEHPDTLGTRHNLAHAYAAAGRTMEAIAIYEPLLTDSERILGSEHPATLRARDNLATAYQAAGRTTEAIAIYEPLLTDSERILGPEHPAALTIRHNLAVAYQAAGRTGEAIAIYERLLTNRERILGPEHPATLGTRHNLAYVYRAAGRTTEAIAIYEPLLTDRERILGPEHHDTLTTRHNLAHAYQDAGRTSEAIAIYKPLLTDRERILGPEHPSTLTTRNNLAHAYQDTGRTIEAIAIYEPLLTDSERILGPEHPNTLTTRNNLAHAYQDAGRTGDAERVRKPPGRARS